ncbi:response regulator transcription factor [Streptomyces sp. TRM64462]|uniref:helix-turn-helix transcriptional regulator n=1 Tax=Streptomyces sp. TRM64462 TaxID=2741726 RepID=UPI0028165A75|nr:response regulator transcription factor [Streptomyces sp. TRM64462]
MTAGVRVRLLTPAGQVAQMLRQTGIEPSADGSTVAVAVTATVEEAVALCPVPGHRLLAVCDTVSPGGLRRALQVGVHAILRSSGLTPAQLAAAVHGAHHGDSRVPYTALVQLLGGATAPDAPRLTPRQTSVLTLMAEGHGNATIARTLSCSPHTVKNTVYELMSRLQARTRAQAVAHAVRHSLI